MEKKELRPLFLSSSSGPKGYKTATQNQITASPSDPPTQTHMHTLLFPLVNSISFGVFFPTRGNPFVHGHPIDLLHDSLQDTFLPEFRNQEELEGGLTCLLCRISVTLCTWRSEVQFPGAFSPGVHCFYEAHPGSCPGSHSSAGSHCHPGGQG